MAKSATHPLTNASCDVCHAGTMVFSKVNPHIPNNTAAPGSCATCHGVQAIGKSASHIPTNQSCDVCHTNFMAFKPAQFQHDASTIGACSTCHNGVSALGKPGAHIPTSSQCDTCHTSQISFLLRIMNHTGLTGQCSTCHGGAYVSQNAQTKTANHFSTIAQCDTCHTSTTTWATSTFVHALPANAVCDSCHNGTPIGAVIPLSKPASHIPTGAQCSTCHTNFVAFRPATMDHTGLTGQCSTCHGGGYTVVNALAKSAVHIPTSRQCDSCHKNFIAFVPASMDHTGLNGQCITCHSGAYRSQNAQVKTPTHQTTSAQCDTCHLNAMVTLSWATSANPHIPVNSALPGTCGTCHGVTAIGKPTTHIPTTGSCDTCHTNFVAFKPAQMSHTGMSGLCSNCHSGSFVFANAQAKNAGHIPTSSSCELCHTNFVTFKPAVMDHTSLAGKCTSCHNGSYLPQNAQQKGVVHVPTATQCDTCHQSTVDWGPMSFIHTATSLAITNNCKACHDGQYLTENAQQWTNATIHGSIGAAQCDSCHTNGASTLSWATTSFNHQTAAPPTPLGVCSSCHKATGPGLPKPGTHITTSTECDTCHKTFTSFRPAAMNHTTETATACVTCHGSINRAPNAQTNTSPPHIPTGVTACNRCHTDTVSWTNRIMDHTGYTSCVTCHGGAYVSENAQRQGANHIATGSSTVCNDCHTGFASWSPAQMDHTKVSPAIACSTCHGGGKLSENAQTKPPTHVPTSAECNSSGCHNAGFTSWRTSANPHLASPPITVTAGSCATCHYAGGSGLSKPSNHIPTTGACDTCHTNFVAFKPSQMNHTGTSGQCASCHGGSFLAANAQTRPSGHIPTSGSCDVCHTNFVAFKPANMDHNGLAGLCANCHNGSYLPQNAQQKGAGHVPTATVCDSCHTSTVDWGPMNFIHTATSLAVTGNCRACHQGQYISENAQVWSNATIHGSIGAAQCDSCHTNGASTLSWATTTFNHQTATPPTPLGVCSSCHKAGGSGLPKPSTHIPTATECDTCHKTFISFRPAAMNHTSESATACATCHGGGYTAANAQTNTSPPHIPTGVIACNRCHTDTVAWANRSMDHTAMTRCVQCHNGSFVSENAQKQGTNHIATGSSTFCNDCHTGFASWSPAQMDHTKVSPAIACSTCHGGGKLSENAQTKPPTHVVTAGECSSCHSGYTSWRTTTNPHTASPPITVATGSCSTCHYAGGAGLSKPSNHIPTTLSCDRCHTNFVAFKPASMSHTGTSGLCLTCHNGSYTAQGAQPANSTHIPTTLQCDNCHNTAAFKPANMNHVNTAGRCSTCHNGSYLSVGTQGAQTNVSPPHVPVATSSCDTCHLSTSSWIPMSFVHTATSLPITSNCIACHSGQYVSENAQTKSATHTTTTAQCDTCHTSAATTLSWATSANPHIPTNTAVAGSCQNAGCHTAGGSGLLKPVTHIPITDSCEVCHTNGLTNFTAFKPAQMSHTAASVVASGCKTCHATGTAYLSVNAQQPGSSHIPVGTTQCNVCHLSAGGAWTSRSMDHTTAAVSGAACTTCHAAGKPYLSENAQQPGSNHITIGSLTCGTCHTNFANFTPAAMNHTQALTVVPLCKTCHDGSKVSENAQAKSANHVSTTADCIICHTAPKHSNYTTWSLGGTPDHSVLGPICNGCHNGTTTALPKPGSHIPTSAQCSSCHILTTNTPASGSFRPATMDHTVGGIGCSTCHNGSYSYANALPQGATHIPTTALCSGCHTPLPSKTLGRLSSALWVTPRAMNHTLVTATGCSTCHSGGYLSENAQQKSGTHIPTTEQCDVCHTSPGSNPSPLWAPVTKHTNLGAGKCQTCHIAAYASAHLLPLPTSGHVPTISFSASWASCDACHKTGYYTAWVNNGVHKAPASRPGSEVTLKCGTCHYLGNPYGIKQPQSVTPHTATKPKSGANDTMACNKSGCHKLSFTSWAP